jgi:hypothetical protein
MKTARASTTGLAGRPAALAQRTRRATALALADGSRGSIGESPAKALQESLSAAMTAHEPAPWSVRASVALLFGASAAFWLLLGLGLRLLLH